MALRRAILGPPGRDLVREEQVRIGYVTSLRASGWPVAAIDAIADGVLTACRSRQAEFAVSLQGGAGSWSEEALGSVLPRARPLHCPTFDDAWMACEEGRAVAAWLPVRNSIVGEIRALSEAFQAEAWLEVDHPVPHALLGAAGATTAGLRRIEAHPLAFEQCRRTLDRLVPNAERVAAQDGAFAAARIGDDPSRGVIASPRVAARFGLQELAPCVADDASNATTFRLLLPRMREEAAVR